MKSTFFGLAAAPALLMFAFAGFASADVLYNNLNQPSNTGTSIKNFSPVADSFSTGSTAFSLTSVGVRFYSFNSNDGGITTVELWSDNSARPGTQLGTIGTIRDNLAGGTSFVTSASPFDLAANTRYWIELTASSANTFWNETNSTSGVGVAGEYYAFGGGIDPTSSGGVFEMEVTGTPAVPEPATFWLLGMGVLALAAWRKRARRTSLKNADNTLQF